MSLQKLSIAVISLAMLAFTGIDASAETLSQNGLSYNYDSPVEGTVSTISVSSVKLSWNAVNDHLYGISCVRADGTTSEYDQNIRTSFASYGTCYITGLREGTDYIIKLADITNNTTDYLLAQTETVNIIEDFPYIDGWTNCFTYESAENLVTDPSASAIEGAVMDPVTNTGIMRNEYGDYCVAMGLFYGRCGDRFLVELENGTQFTVKICDSKGYGSDGDGIYTRFSNNGKSIIEFIHSSYLPTSVQQSGNYGSYDWDGLIFDDILSISQIEYGNTISY